MWLILVILVVSAAQIGNAYGYVVSSMARTPETAFLLFSGLVFPWSFYSGLMISYDDIPVYFVWLAFTSTFKYLYTALVINVWQNVDKLDCPAARCPYKDGKDVLEQFDVAGSEMVSSVCAIIALVVTFRVLAWLGSF